MELTPQEEYKVIIKSQGYNLSCCVYKGHDWHLNYNIATCNKCGKKIFKSEQGNKEVINPLEHEQSK